MSHPGSSSGRVARRQDWRQSRRSRRITARSDARELAATCRCDAGDALNSRGTRLDPRSPRPRPPGRPRASASQHCCLLDPHGVDILHRLVAGGGLEQACKRAQAVPRARSLRERGSPPHNGRRARSGIPITASVRWALGQHGKRHLPSVCGANRCTFAVRAACSGAKRLIRCSAGPAGTSPAGGDDALPSPARAAPIPRASARADSAAVPAAGRPVAGCLQPVQQAGMREDPGQSRPRRSGRHRHGRGAASDLGRVTFAGGHRSACRHRTR